jgi:hypothetical protein
MDNGPSFFQKAELEKTGSILISELEDDKALV